MKRKIFTVAFIITLMISQAFVVGATELNDERISDAMGMNADRDSMDTATSISLDRTYSGAITSTNAEDYYKFTLNASGKLNITATAWMQYICYNIYDASGNQVFTMTPNWNGTTGIISSDYTVDLISGTYYFVVEKFIYTGDYTFKLNFTSANESYSEMSTDMDNSMNTANYISVNAKYNGQIAANDEKDFYKFTLNQSGRVNMTISARILYIHYYIYDISGNEIWGRDPSWNATTQRIDISEDIDLTAGTYYLVVEKGLSYTGNYSFSLDYSRTGESFEENGSGINNTMESANTIALARYYDGQIAANDEKDFYKFTLNQSGRVNLTMVASILYIHYYIYDMSGEKILGRDPSWNATTQRIDISEDMDLTAGTYYFVVEKGLNYTGNYRFMFSQHTHNYKTEVTKATINSNGSIVKRCSCGAVQSSSVIYRPRWYTISPKTYEYNGKKRTPSITMTDAAGRIISSSNYSLTYPSGRKNVGTYRIKVTMKGNYTGSFYASFDIIPKSTSIVKLSPKTKGFKVVWKKNSTVSGYQVQYSTSKKFTGTKTKTISGKKNESVTISGLKAKKKYYVRVRTYKTVRGKKYFSDWSKVRSVKTK